MVNIYAAPKDLLQIIKANVPVKQHAARAICSAEAQAVTMTLYSVATKQTQRTQSLIVNWWEKSVMLLKNQDLMFAEPNAAKELVTEIIVPNAILQTQIHVRLMAIIHQK